MQLKRSLGQVFLSDEAYIHRIIEALDVRGRNVLEIGPGDGAVSAGILKKAKRLYAVELDPRLCRVLRTKFEDTSKLEVICSDILKFPLSELGRDLIVFGNVPYQISSRLVRYLVGYRQYISRAYLTLQREFVRKLVAEATDSDYNFLSCYLQYYARISNSFDIPAEAFYPVPKVNSAFIAIEFYPDRGGRTEDADFLFKVIRQAFSGSRKKIINSLKGLATKEELLAVGIKPGSRPSDITLKKYIALSGRLRQSGGRN